MAEGLKKYHAKRQFGQTPEPKGVAKKSKGKLAFVVQQHHASSMHYDFRLEMNGVLKSWAVPKGPSLNPHDHHLAIQTEDHPMEYRKFEGVIPEGNYGAGNVIIWDEGIYEPRAETKTPEKSLLADLKKGHITFIVHGKKLKGEFALIRLQNAEQKNAWLLVKKGDEFASTKDITKQDKSIKSDQKVDDLGGPHTPLALTDYPKRAAPWKVKPMLCTLVDDPFNRKGWLFEIKWDGYRAIASKHKTTVTLLSRNQNNLAPHYGPVVEALRALKHDVILDGEIVIVDNHGRAHFEWIQHWATTQKGELLYYVFDILWLDGRDLRTMPLIERKKLLKRIIPGRGPIRYSDHIEDKGLTLYNEMTRRGLEGIIAKRADSQYKEDVRGESWQKVKTHLRQEVVIGGYTEPRGSRSYFGSLVVGVYSNGELQYVGHSGGGISDRDRKELLAKLKKLSQTESPFAQTPTTNEPAHWVKPKLVCEMAFSEWTAAGTMRHPTFMGMRSDKSPTKVVREQARKVRS